MYYWFDLGHPKQAWQARVILDRLGLRPDSENVFISARGALGTIEVANALGLAPLEVGSYYSDLYHKLIDDLLRAKRLADFAQLFSEDAVLITFGMPSGIRTAFGLKIPIIHINDTPHNEPVRRLTAALSDYIITPISELHNRKDTPARRAIIGYFGVPEMSYVPKAEDLMPGRPLERAKELVEELSPFIFFRYAEWKASYGVGSLSEFYEMFRTVREIARSYGYNLLVYPRYPDENLYGEGVHVLDIKRVVNLPYLIRHAELVISSGGSIAKEAAIQGVPAVVTSYRLDQTRRLKKQGFPLYDGRYNLVDSISRALEEKESISVPPLEKYDKIDEIVLKCLSAI